MHKTRIKESRMTFTKFITIAILILIIVALAVYDYGRIVTCDVDKVEIQANLSEIDLYADLELKESLKIYEPKEPVQSLERRK